MIDTVAHHAQPQMPMWPFVLLVVLLMMGLSFSRERLVSARAVTIIPVVMVLVSLSAVRSAFGLQPLTAAAWMVGLATAALVTVAGRWPRGVTWNPGARRLRVPGSWVPLMLFIGIFTSRFAVGTVQAMHLPILADPGFVASMALVYGAFSGVFLGRSIVMWRAVPAGAGRLADTPELTAAAPRP